MSVEESVLRWFVGNSPSHRSTVNFCSKLCSLKKNCRNKALNKYTLLNRLSKKQNFELGFNLALHKNFILNLKCQEFPVFLCLTWFNFLVLLLHALSLKKFTTNLPMHIDEAQCLKQMTVNKRNFLHVKLKPKLRQNVILICTIYVLCDLSER